MWQLGQWAESTCSKGAGLESSGEDSVGVSLAAGLAVGSRGRLDAQQGGGFRMAGRGLGQPPVFGGAVGGGWGGSWEELGGVVLGLGQGHSYLRCVQLCRRQKTVGITGWNEHLPQRGYSVKTEQATVGQERWGEKLGTVGWHLQMPKCS